MEDKKQLAMKYKAIDKDVLADLRKKCQIGSIVAGDTPSNVLFTLTGMRNLYNYIMGFVNMDLGKEEITRALTPEDAD